jgi:hypothetical protein
MNKMLSKIPVLLLATVLSASAGGRPDRMRSVTDVSRAAFQNNGEFQQFAFRGGVVNYWPLRGAQWTAGRGAVSGETFATTPESANLPNGCLVYACARAEQIRLRSQNGESQSRVITYRRADGSGHAFVLYKSGKTFVGEDNFGNRTPMPSFENRSASEALFMARTFQKRTSIGSFTPVQATFVGKF